jgi:histidinol-phosphate aminotransferase
MYDVPGDRLVVGAGSGALLQLLFQAVAGPGVEAVFAWRSFEIYPILADLAGVRAVRVPLRADAHDVSAMIERITPRTRLVIVCQPNNPTGTVLSTSEVERLMAHVPPDCLVALDEAYFEYVRDPQAADGIALHERWPNLVVLRTLSKAYSLAGLRVGYLVGHARVAARLRAMSLPFSLSAPAQAAAIAALRLRGPLMERVDSIVAERGRVRKTLIAQGWQVPKSEANFLWLGLGDRTDAFVRWCATHSIALRGFSGEGVRVSLGTPVDDDAFLTACEGWPEQA